MNRRLFFRNSSFLALGAIVATPFNKTYSKSLAEINSGKEKAKNIIFLVSDGMSSGTLTMADQFLYRSTGQRSNWMKLYEENLVSRSLMETASANSIVTDSAAASSSWGGGVRVNNGSLNINPDGSSNNPILQKFKKMGKKVGCVTTVPITHATPAGFCVATTSRNDQNKIAELYLSIGFDVMLGGGANYFSANSRPDKKDLLQAYKSANWQVVRNKKDLFKSENKKPVLGLFANDALPYTLDHLQDKSLQDTAPTLAEMTASAIELMKGNEKGFALQVEAGKVDWAAHGNDIGGLIKDQIAFDDAIKVAIDFAQKDKSTLVIITTDHANSNPGLSGGEVNANFDSIQKYRHSNEWILNGIDDTTSLSQLKERIEYANPDFTVNDEEASLLQSYYRKLNTETGVYNARELPFRALAEMQKKRNSVGWISMDHASDHVELAAFGPGSQLIPAFVINTDLHNLMLQVST